MRFSDTSHRGAALLGALTLALALTGVPATVATAATPAPAATGTHAATGRQVLTGTHAGTGENTPLHLKTSTAVHHAASTGSSGILRTIIALVIVIVLIYAVARILKAVKGHDQKASGDGLDHIATLPLGPNKSVALVRSGSDIVLIGVAESGVTPIKTYTEEEARANGLIGAEDEVPSPRRDSSFEGFLDTLRKITVRT
jgi:flagellar biogenesis protein FliO